MKVKNAAFITSAVRPEGYPDEGGPEIVFAGRSNVGKSSLINSLTGRKGLVKISKTPGKTQLLNFFSINDRVIFVDTPGYGFARAPVRVKKGWGVMIERYFKSRKSLKGAILLLDCRRVPNNDDRILIEWFNHYHIPFLLVITKIDKVGKSYRKREISKVMAAIADLVEEGLKPLVYSSRTGEGKKELWGVIGEMTGEEGPVSPAPPK